jgi:hypothetical protein
MSRYSTIVNSWIWKPPRWLWIWWAMEDTLPTQLMSPDYFLWPDTKSNLYRHRERPSTRPRNESTAKHLVLTPFLTECDAMDHMIWAEHLSMAKRPIFEAHTGRMALMVKQGMVRARYSLVFRTKSAPERYGAWSVGDSARARSSLTPFEGRPVLRL